MRERERERETERDRGRERDRERDREHRKKKEREREMDRLIESRRSGKKIGDEKQSPGVHLWLHRSHQPLLLH